MKRKQQKFTETYTNMYFFNTMKNYGTQQTKMNPN